MDNGERRVQRREIREKSAERRVLYTSVNSE